MSKRRTVKVRVSATTRDEAIMRAVERAGSAALWGTRAVPESKRFAQAGVAQDWLVTVEIMEGYDLPDVRSDAQKRLDRALGR